MKTNIFLIILTINIFRVRAMCDLINTPIENTTLTFFTPKIQDPKNLYSSFLTRLASLSNFDQQEWPIIPIEHNIHIMPSCDCAYKVLELINKLKSYSFKDIFSDTPYISSSAINEINEKYEDFINVITIIYWKMNNDVINNKILSIQGDMDSKYLTHINKFITERLQYGLDKIDLRQTCPFFVRTLEKIKNSTMENSHNMDKIPSGTHQFLAFRENNLLHKIDRRKKGFIQNYFLTNNPKLNHYIKCIKNLLTSTKEEDEKDII